MRKLNRREFSQEASLAFLAGVAVTVSGCGGGGGTGGSGNDDGYGAPTGTTPTTVASVNKTGQIEGNHGHQAVITAAQLQAGGALQIDIAYVAGHSHIVDLPAQAVQEIRDGRPVSKESTSTEGHSHKVTFNPDSSGERSDY